MLADKAMIEELKMPLETAKGAAFSEQTDVLTKIYDTAVNIAVWQRQLPNVVVDEVANLIQTTSNLNISAFINANNIENDIQYALKSTELTHSFINNTAELVDMFCTLFELTEAGLRIRLLDSPMCPRFHVDRVPCRMVTTFSGRGTQWIEHNKVDRDKLGHGSQGLDDRQSGLFQTPADIQTLSTGDVALLKGEAWVGNENAGIVHRSPPIESGEKRLLMTLDFLS